MALREVWKHEALHFTTWLEENLDLIGDVLGLNLAVIQREHSAGDFDVDLVAQEGAGDLVVIENQLERSDHDHLGKLVTYVSMIGARRAIWIVAQPRPEHVKAIQWLNEAGTASFHLLKLEAIKIGGSEPAPLFTAITGPSEAINEAGRVKRNQESSSGRYARFWESLLNEARKRTSLHQSISPSEGNWVSSRADMPKGFGLGYVLSRGKGRVELYIDDDKKGKVYTEAIFHALEQHKIAVETSFGGPLNWEELPTGRACRIGNQVEAMVDLDDEATWPAFTAQMIDAMIQLNGALRPYLKDAVSAAEESLLLTEPLQALPGGEDVD